MTSDRIQRLIEALLDDADRAVAAGAWAEVRSLAEAVLALAPDNADALAYVAAANRARNGLPDSGAAETPWASAESPPAAVPPSDHRAPVLLEKTPASPPASDSPAISRQREPRQQPSGLQLVAIGVGAVVMALLAVGLIAVASDPSVNALSIGVALTAVLAFVVIVALLAGENPARIDRSLAPDASSRLAQLILQALLTLVAIPIGLATPFTQFVSGIAIGFPLLGLVSLLFLSVVWLAIFVPLYGTSWVWLRVPWFRPVLLLVGVPFAILSYAFNVLIAVGPADQEDAARKTLASILWPYSTLAFAESEDLGRAIDDGRVRFPRSLLTMQAGANAFGCFSLALLLLASLGYLAFIAIT